MRLTITYGLALIAGVLALTKLDQPTRIMFNPATDGPIRSEEKTAYSAPISGGSTGACLTTLTTDGGKSGTAVYTPCTSTGTYRQPTYTVTVGGGGGGSR